MKKDARGEREKIKKSTKIKKGMTRKKKICPVARLCQKKLKKTPTASRLECWAAVTLFVCKCGVVSCWHWMPCKCNGQWGVLAIHCGYLCGKLPRATVPLHLGRRLGGIGRLVPPYICSGECGVLVWWYGRVVGRVTSVRGVLRVGTPCLRLARVSRAYSSLQFLFCATPVRARFICRIRCSVLLYIPQHVQAAFHLDYLAGDSSRAAQGRVIVIET